MDGGNLEAEKREERRKADLKRAREECNLINLPEDEEGKQDRHWN